jgi:hypothetical protein
MLLGYGRAFHARVTPARISCKHFTASMVGEGRSREGDGGRLEFFARKLRDSQN